MSMLSCVREGPTSRPAFPRLPLVSSHCNRILHLFPEGERCILPVFALIRYPRPFSGIFVCGHEVMPCAPACPAARPGCPRLSLPDFRCFRLLHQFLGCGGVILPVSAPISLPRPLLGRLVCEHDVVSCVRAGPSSRPSCPRLRLLACQIYRLPS